ncbi:hypothetical protein, partial [Clavibacter michiganensis]|uniref:hypothetical protein n=1 Tax=Clavibacter michiganensis TaxID=28447 RepID=UPI002930F337
ACEVVGAGGRADAGVQPSIVERGLRVRGGKGFPGAAALDAEAGRIRLRRAAGDDHADDDGDHGDGGHGSRDDADETVAAPTASLRFLTRHISLTA